MRLQVAFTLVVGVLPLFAAAGWARNPQDRGRQIATWPDATSAELADVPPGQVIVSYENGELTIKAKNAPLGDVLRAVCVKVGAELVAPPEARQPILMILGPAPARLALAYLLDQFQFNFAMMAGAHDPNALASVVVFSESKDSKLFGSVEEAKVIEEQSGSKVGASTTTDTGSRSDARQMMKELLTAAKAEINSGGLVLDAYPDSENAGDGNPASTAPQPDAAAALKLVEARLAAIGDSPATSTGSSQTAQEPAAVPSQNAFSIPRRGRR